LFCDLFYFSSPPPPPPPPPPPSGHGLPDKGNQERSPIFLQWLDVLHQVRSQFPDAFEFNDDLLVFLADHVYSGLFGTFLGDCERDRVSPYPYLDCCKRTISVWTYVLSRADRFLNRGYAPLEEPIWPSSSMKKLGLWARYFSRWDPEVHPRDAGNSSSGDGRLGGQSWQDDWGSPLPLSMMTSKAHQAKRGPTAEAAKIVASGSEATIPILLPQAQPPPYTTPPPQSSPTMVHQKHLSHYNAFNRRPSSGGLGAGYTAASRPFIPTGKVGAPSESPSKPPWLPSSPPPPPPKNLDL
jgi:hypothetical protein